MEKEAVGLDQRKNSKELPQVWSSQALKIWELAQCHCWGQRYWCSVSRTPACFCRLVTIHKGAVTHESTACCCMHLLTSACLCLLLPVAGCSTLVCYNCFLSPAMVRYCLPLAHHFLWPLMLLFTSAASWRLQNCQVFEPYLCKGKNH